MNRLLNGTLLLATTVLVGCSDISFGGETVTGSGPIITESRAVGRFYAVANATLADVEILQGTTERVRIRGQENLMPYLRTRVDGNVLRITTEPGINIRTTEQLVIEIDLVELVRLENSGSGFMRAPVLDAFDLEVITSGSGRIELPDLLADTLIVISSGSGEVNGSGTVLSERLIVSGSGRVELRTLQANDANVTLSGAGPATIRVRDRLRAVLSGSGTLRYYGSPQVTQTVTGTGRVERAGS